MGVPPAAPEELDPPPRSCGGGLSCGRLRFATHRRRRPPTSSRAPTAARWGTPARHVRRFAPHAPKRRWSRLPLFFASHLPFCLTASRLCTSAVSFSFFLVEAGFFSPLHFSWLFSRSPTNESVIHSKQCFPVTFVSFLSSCARSSYCHSQLVFLFNPVLVVAVMDTGSSAEPPSFTPIIFTTPSSSPHRRRSPPSPLFYCRCLPPPPCFSRRTGHPIRQMMQGYV